MKNFAVVRICNKQDGTIAIPVSSFESETEAVKEYFRLCGLAVDSTHLTDAVTLLTKEGFELRHECFEHEPQNQQQQQTPEPSGE